MLIAGDLFHNWNAPPELVNFVLRITRGWEIYAVPGNHDLPNSRYSDLKRSAFWTLVKADAIRDVHHSQPVRIPGYRGIRVHGFIECAEDLCPPVDKRGEDLEVALVHGYVWRDGREAYPGAPPDAYYLTRMERLKGFDLAVFGDNHHGFEVMTPGHDMPSVYNCGCFVRRRSDERHLRPAVGVIYSDGTVERRYLDTKHDRFLDIVEPAVVKSLGMDYEELMNILRNAADTVASFRDAVRVFLRESKVDPAVESVILGWVDRIAQT